MRASVFAFFGAALSLATPANAGPAYKSVDVIKYLLEAKDYEPTRVICFEGDPVCKVKKPPPFDLQVNFDFDSERLTPAAQKQLGEFARALRDPRLEGLKIAIDGFTDATGAETYNLSLSDRRAESVVGFLAANGVKRVTLVAKGFGPAKPRAANPFDPLNRRVEAHLAE